jgi:soluble lytic murein transglycosylase-like protein
VYNIWKRYGDLCSASAKRYGVPVELVVATIATESRGNPNARRSEPRIRDESVGLMQTLVATAQGALGRQGLKGDDLLDPVLSIEAGTAYIAQQRGASHFDPPLVAATYNAGSIRRDNGDANRWKLLCFPTGTGRHVDSYVEWFSDYMRVSVEQEWGQQEGVPSFAQCFAKAHGDPATVSG